MKTILLFLALWSGAVLADPRIENLVAHCERVMSLPGDVCGVARDRKDYTGSTVVVAGLGRLKTDAYLWIREPRYDKNPDGTFKMCSRIREACTAAWDGPDERCKAARWKWRQQ
jgi:hypothetical protein